MSNSTPQKSVITTQPANLPKRARQSIAASSMTPDTAAPIPTDIDAALMGLLPDDFCAQKPIGTVVFDNRSWLPHDPTISTCDSGAIGVDFGDAPDGLSEVERVLWSSVGRACARVALFLYEWLKTRKYMRACELSGANTALISMCSNSSPVFRLLYDRCEGIIRSHRHAESEDTLHALANGEFRKIKVVSGPDGVVTTDDGAIYDSKALALELAAGDRQRYGQVQQVAAPVQISIQLSIPRPADVPVARIVGKVIDVQPDLPAIAADDDDAVSV